MEFLGSFHVNYKIKLGRLLNGQIRGLGALEDFVDIRGCSAEEIGIVRAIRSKTASLNELLRSRYGRQAALHRHIDNLLPMVLDREIDDETAYGRLLQCRKSVVQLS